METSEIEEKVYTALKNNATITGLLANADKSIFHLQAPEVFPELPILVYTPISDVPALYGDNQEQLHRVTMRIHIVHGEYDYSELYSEIKNIMQALGFIRQQTTTLIDDDGVKMLIIDFKIVIGG